jgi:hypothetical protein
MSKLDIINSILNENFKDESEFLSEKDKDKHGKDFEMKRKIIGGNQLSYCVYKYDVAKDILPFFKTTGVTGLKKICDYLLFIEEGEHLFVFLVEMKKGTESAKRQLDAGQCFSEYIISTINRLNLDIGISNQNLHFRKIRISESKSKKVTLKKGIIEKENGVIEHQHPNCFYIQEYLTY